MYERYKYYKYIRSTYNFLVALLRFWFGIITFKILSFQGFYTLKGSLVATLSKMGALTSRTCVAEQGMNFPYLSKTLTFLWSLSTFFAREK